MTVHHLLQGGNFALPKAHKHYAPDMRIVPTHLNLWMQIELENRSFQAIVTHTLMAKVGNVDQIELDAIDVEIITITSPNGSPCNWQYNGKKVAIHWDTPFSANEQRQIEIQYKVENPINGMLFGGPTKYAPDTGRWMVTDHETQRARYWLPCLDHTAFRTPLDITIKHRKEYLCIGPGYQESQVDHQDGWTSTTWILQQKCPSYLLCIAVGDFTKWDGGSYEGIPIAAFAPKPCTEETLKRNFGITADLLSFFHRYLGPLPWPKYYQIAADGIGGAMENISLVSWDGMFLFDKVMFDDWGIIVDQINAHEMAHTWFGDLVVCKDYAHLWLKESWATYMEVVWVNDKFGKDHRDYELLQKRKRYFGEANSSYTRAIMTRTFDTPWSMYDAHLYPGGAVRLHMLRCDIGEEAFWNGVKSYLTKFAERTVETIDFIREMELHSGRSLQHFFEQWFASPGYPKLDIKYKFMKAKQRISLTISQKIQGSEAKSFTFPLELAIEHDDDTWSRHTIDIKEPKQSFQLQCDSEPKQIIIDPDCRSVIAFQFDPGRKILLHSLVNSPFVHGRIHAAKTLAKSAHPKAIKALQEQANKEAFFGVRISIAESLGQSKCSAARKALIHMLSQESNSRVLFAIAQACGGHRHAEMAMALSTFLERHDIAYRSRSAALSAMAKQRQNCNWDLLIQATQDTGWWSFVARGAYSALGETQSELGLTHLIDCLYNYKKPPQVRMLAALAIPKCANHLEKRHRQRAVESLCEFLQDDNYRVRLSAIRALKALPCTSAIVHLESARPTITEQDQPLIDRAIAAARQQNPDTEAQKWSARLADLESTINALRDRIEQLESKEKQNDCSSSPS